MVLVVMAILVTMASGGSSINNRYKYSVKSNGGAMKQ